jgi:GNAT superfamily N-acetyltransferase
MRSDRGNPDTTPTIVAARDQTDWEAARAIIHEHITWISASIGLDYADEAQPAVHRELAGLERYYTPPKGRLFLARLDAVPAGTVGVLTLADGVAELKRLYVRPIARGHNLGAALVQSAVRAADEAGCHTLRLSTLPGVMDAAISLYRRMGFHETEPYGDVSLDGLLYLARPVSPSASARAA